MSSISPVEFKPLFETAPGLFLIISPDFKIIAVSDAYLEATLTRREEIVGKGLFEVFPDNPDDKNADGVSNLRSSIETVFKEGKPHKMGIQKYDIRRPDGVFEERYWSPTNTPVFNDEQEIVCILHSAEDITSSHLQKKKFEKLEGDYQLLINSVRDYAIFMVDVNGIVISWNTGAERINGYEADEIIGVSMEVFYMPDDISKGIPESNLKNALLNGHVETEGWRRRKQGTTYWVSNVITALKDEEGELYGYSIIARDITERKRAQEQVESLSMQINQANDAIYTVDAAFIIKSWNKGAEKLYGYSGEEAIGKSSLVLLNKVLSENELAMILKKLSDTDYWSGESQRITKDGTVIYVQSSSTTIRDSAGVIIGYTSVSFDITEQKRLRAQLKHLASIAEQSSEAIISRDLSQRLISWNKGAEILFGYSSAEALGKTAKELGIINSSDQELQEFAENILTYGSWKSEMEFYHKNGTPFYGAFAANAIMDENSECSSIVFIIKDISIHKQLEAHLKKSNDELEEKVRIRTELNIKNERRFQALIENSNDIITLMDESFRLLYRSPAATRILGWTDEDMIGVDATKNIYTEDRVYTSAVVQEVISNPGISVNTKFRMMHKEGHYLWLEGTLTNLLHDQFIKAIVFNFRNITERVEAEDRLLVSERNFRSTLDNMLEGIQIHDFNWKYLYMNESMVSFSRNTREGLMGKSLIEIYPGIEETKLFHTLNRCMKERVSERLETEFNFPDGTKSYFHLSIQPHPEGLLILSVDITKNKETENALIDEQDKFARIVASSPGLIYSFKLTPDGKMSFPYASKVFEDIFGIPYEELKDHVEIIIDSSVKEDRERLLTSIAQSAQSMSPWKLQFRYNHPKKGLVWLDGNSIPTSNPDGSILWHGVIMDVTERKIAEDKINEQNLRIKTISDNLPGMMLFQLTGETYENRKFTYVSNGVKEMTGKSPQEVLSDPSVLYNLILKEDIPNVVAAEIDSYKNITPFNVEARCLDYKGDLHWLNIISVPRKLNNGSFVWDGFHLDITDRKRIQEQLFEREKQLELFIEHSPVAMAMFDKNMRYIAASNRWAMDYKLERQQLIGKVHYDLFSYLPEKWKSVHQRCMNGVVEKNDEDYFKMNDGTSMWLRWEVRPWYTALDEVGGIIIFAEDITEKKLAEQQKEFDSNNLKALINNTDDLMWSVDRNYHLITSNEAFDMIINKMIGSSLSKGSNVLLEEFKSNGLASYKSFYDRAFKGEAFTEIEHNGTDNDRWSEISFYPIYEGKKVIGTACFSRNITEMIKAEMELKKSYHEKQALAKRMSIILNTLQANIALLDSNGVIIEVNDAWRNFARNNGFIGSNFCVGDNYLQVSRNASGPEAEDGKRVSEGIEAVLKKHQKEFVYEYTCHAPRVKRWYRMIVNSLQEQEYAGAVVMHIDISELKKLEEERFKIKMQEQKKIAKAIIIEQERERNYIGQELHDNINQILAGTKMYLRVASNKSKEVKELIQYPMELIDTSIEGIRSLCHNMVTPLNDIDLEGLTRDLLNKLEQNVKIKTQLSCVLFNKELSDDLKLTIYRIIQELLNNVQKYAEADTVKVEIRSNKKFISIVVKDNGKGFVLDKKRKGIGISNIINRVKSFDGEIDIKSETGQGCITSIKIPH